MSSIRENKMARLIQKELGSLFLQQGISYGTGIMITVTVVRMSPDLSVAKVYISIFPSKEKEKVFQSVSENAKMLRHELGKRIRHQVKSLPDLIFYVDDSLDYAENIDRLLKS